MKDNDVLSKFAFDIIIRKDIGVSSASKILRNLILRFFSSLRFRL